ncbi:MAG: hypothetical protein IAE79_05820 [Anaerolinea sp.]|nr:hypothetical protein [Anaerolinea sp.]
MPIINYTTKVDIHKTLGEVQSVLAKAGARSISVDYDEQALPVAVTFIVKIGTQYVNFRLPSNWEGVHRRIDRDQNVPKRLKTEEQARRVAWRIVKDWIEAQMAIVDAGLAVLPEVFLPYVVNPQTGVTLYQEFSKGVSLFLD